MSEPRWLSQSEQSAWRSTITGALVMVDQLDRDLRTNHDLTLADYEILMHLSEAPDAKLRMSDLADAALVSRSRLTHRVNRLGSKALIEREACPTDKRGMFAVLTPAGQALIELAAVTHVESVRTHVLDRLSTDDLTRLGALLGQVAAPLLADSGQE